MKITGIIAEYNPLHNGHVFHIEKARALTNADGIVAVMSGNFVQRGLPAMIDKWNRTKMALENGVDLVLELPVLYSLSSAEFFAHGAVSLLNNIGVVSNLSFGSECGDGEILNLIAKVLCEEPAYFKKMLKIYLDSGLTYPSARSKALYDFFNADNSFTIEKDFEKLLNSSNNILGIEYCKSLIKLKSSIGIVTIQREGGGYNSTALDEKFSSATSIRKFIAENEDLEKLESQIPRSCYMRTRILKENKYPFVFEDFIFPYIKYKSFTNGKIELLPDVSEGLHNKIYKSIAYAANYKELLQQIKSKRYTHTRISRSLCQYFVGFESFDTEILRQAPAPYAKILGFNSTGIQILKRIKKNTSIPVFTKMPKQFNDTLALDLQATRAYSLLNHTVSPYNDFFQSPIYIK